MAVSREVTEGTQLQGTDESVYYKLTTTPWGSTPTSISVKAFSKSDSDLTDVTSTVLSGSVSTDGDVITLPKFYSLTEGTLYRVEVKFTESGGNVYEAYFYVQAER